MVVVVVVGLDVVVVVVVVESILAVDGCVLFVLCCRSLLTIGIGTSLVSMMLVEATDELKNLEVISLIRPLPE